MFFRRRYEPPRRHFRPWRVAARAALVAVVAAQVPTSLIVITSVTVAVLAVVIGMSANNRNQRRWKESRW